MLEQNKLRCVYVNITNTCNLKCIYCYDIHSKNAITERISIEEYKNLSNDLKKLKADEVVITGGEPLTRKEWFEISKTFREKDLKIYISTNGTLVNDDVIEKFKLLNAKVQISLDGDSHIMDYITRVDGTYPKIITTIEKLKRNNVTFMLNCVLGSHNKDSIFHLNKLSKEFEIKIRISLYMDSANKAEDKIKQLSIQEIDQIIYIVEDLRINNKNIFLNLPPLLLPYGNEPELSLGCGWAYNTAGVLANGDVTICGIASGLPELVAGNIKKDSFYHIWNNSELFNKLRNYSIYDLKGICAECPVKSYCGGACRLDTYRRTNSFCEAFQICQEYYDAMITNKIERKKFPSGMLEVI